MKQLQVYGWSWNKFIGYRTKRYLNFAQLSHHNFQCKNPKLTLKGDQAFLIIKPTRCTNYSNLFLEWNSTCFGQFLCPSSGVFHCTHSNGACHTVLQTACKQDQDGMQFHPDPAGGRQHRGCIIPQAVTHSLVLLKMGKVIARNMLSWLDY